MLFSRAHSRPAKTSIQVLSDLHLEVDQQYSSFTFPVSAPYLLLAGDIGRLIDYEGYLEFLEAQVARFEKVFLVLGNHEFYGDSHESGIEKAQRLTQEPSLRGKYVLLHQKRWDDPKSDLTILGCTLWSFILDDKREIVQSKLNDFKKITGWDVSDHNRVQADEVAWLRGELSSLHSANNPSSDSSPQFSDRNVLVATHYAPLVDGTSSPQHADNPWTCGFATDLLKEGTWHWVKAWVFGHTHFSTDFLYNGIRLVSNQRGYVLSADSPLTGGDKREREKGAHVFDPAWTIKV